VTRPFDDEKVIEFDHTSPEYARAADRIMHEIRATCPVAYTESNGGHWIITSYESFAGAMRNEQAFSSRHESVDEPDGIRFMGVNIPEAPYINALVEMDPPEWNVFRKILNPMFSPPAIAAMEGELLDFTDSCIDRHIETGAIDFVLDLANPVPAMAVLALLGLPLDDWERYAAPAHEVVYTRPGTPEFQRAVDGQAWMFQSIAETIAERRRRPGDDNLSAIILAEVNGRSLTDAEIISLLGTVINGGVDTTTSLLANAIELLDRDHELRARLVAEPELILSATEEFLRYFSPVQAFARTVAQDVELEGAALQRGDRALMCFGAVNRDDREFPDADAFVAERFPNRHVAFGLGKHRCIGSTLARTEFAVMLRQVLARMPDFEIDRSRTTRYPSLGIVNGYVEMPGTFTPGPRVRSS
jgi:cytochrome P450